MPEHYYDNLMSSGLKKSKRKLKRRKKKKDKDTGRTKQIEKRLRDAGLTEDEIKKFRGK